MRCCHQQAAVAAAATASAAAAAVLSNRRSGMAPPATHDGEDTSCAQSTKFNHTAMMRTRRMNENEAMHREIISRTSPLGSWAANPRSWLALSCSCEALPDGACADAKSTTSDGADASQTPKIDFYYKKMDPDDIERTSLLDSHAVFGALWGEGLIERYNVFQRVEVEQKEQNAASRRELTVVDFKLGSRLNGHGGIAHGGIISLLFDEAMGWAYECLQEQQSVHNDSASTDATVVTASLTVDFRAPFLEGSEAVIRVYHDETRGRKIYFSAKLESMDGSVVFAEAKSLFILVRSDTLKKAIKQSKQR